MTFEDLHAKYAKGDRLSDQEFDSFLSSVGEFAAMARQAESIFGRGAVNYLNLLESSLLNLERARAKVAAEERRLAGLGR